MLRRSIRFSPYALVLLSGSLLACDGGAKKELEAKLQNTQQELSQVRAKSEDRDKLYEEVIDAARFVSDIQLDQPKVPVLLSVADTIRLEMDFDLSRQ